MKEHVLVVATVAMPSLVAGTAVPQQKAEKSLSPEAARGKYQVQIAGCNHYTPGYAECGGKVEEKLWLTGDRLRWRGPRGTTYAPNLRLSAQKLTADQFMILARSTQLRPPMPWFTCAT